MRPRRGLQFYIVAVMILAIAALATLPAQAIWDRPGLLLVLLAASGAAGAWPVRFRSLTVRFTVTHPVIFCTLALLGPYPAVLSTLAGVVGATLPKGRPALDIRLPFNLAAQGISAVAAGWTFLLAGGRGGAGVLDLLLPLGLAAAAYFFASTSLVSTAIALEKDSSPLVIWKETFLWSSVSYSTGYTFAVCMISLIGSVGVVGLLLCVPPCWMLLSFYRAHREMLAEQERRISEVEGMNQQLERKVVERTGELQKTNEELVEANRAKSAFLAGVSHELRTPLNAIIGFSELISEPCYGGLGDQQKEFLRAIHDSGEHLLVLINDILDLSKIEAGRMEARMQATDTAEAIHEAVSMLGPEATRKRIDLAESHGVTGMRFLVDPGMFREIVINLLSNAVKFTPEEGRVEVRSVLEGPDLVVTVQDTGIGIPAEDHRRIFQEFYQVDGSYTRKYQGTGLGLALVKRMMELHGGIVSVTSEPGRGAQFLCRFPNSLVAEKIEGQPEGQSEGDPAERGARPLMVLVAESDDLSRRLACNALKSRGYRVVDAAEGRTALEAVESLRPDLVLVDEALPSVDGREIVRRMKADPTLAAIPVIGLMRPDGESPVDVPETDFTGTIRKPIRISSFPAQVEACIDSRENVA